jgi:hypothetical protein
MSAEVALGGTWVTGSELRTGAQHWPFCRDILFDDTLSIWYRDSLRQILRTLRNSFSCPGSLRQPIVHRPALIVRSWKYRQQSMEFAVVLLLLGEHPPVGKQ